MKQVFIFWLAVLSLPAFAQTKGTAKIYGFKRAATSGVNQKAIEEGTGKEITKPSTPGYSYFLYMASASRIYPSEIWIDGQAYSAKTETVSKTPIEIEDTNVPIASKKTVLVPKTSLKVTRLMPAPAIDVKSSAKAKTLAGANELVVVYKMNGKFYYQTLNKLTPLETLTLQ